LGIFAADRLGRAGRGGRMMRWWPPLVHLAVIAGAFALALLRLEALGAAALPPDPVADEAATEMAQGAVGAPEAEGTAASVDLAALAARPLFVAGRKPISGVAGAESPLADDSPPAPGFRMVGFLNDGNRPRAILSPDPASPDVILREGEEIQGFTVFSIRKDAVVLRNGDEEITVNMFGQ